MNNRIDSYTSTGAKFWYHTKAMKAYLKGFGHSIISTHISPEGSCNLNCSFCSVKKRNTKFRIPLDTIKDYIEKLSSRGLKGVIITGGGEPSLYPHINELIEWLKYKKKLSIGLITNGTNSNNIHLWEALTWVRVSINRFSNWEKVISLPVNKLTMKCTIGCSIIYTDQSYYFLKKAENLAHSLTASYIRIVPNCLCSNNELQLYQDKMQTVLKKLNDTLFMPKLIIHKLPKGTICHQSYFRPYLSEVDNGTVYPCDSLVLNNNFQYFHEKYQLCKAKDILHYLDEKIPANFSVQQDCTACMFADNINLLENWRNNKKVFKIKEGITHAEFP